MRDPSEYTVEELKDWARDADLTDSDLRALYRDERDGDHRVTLTDWLESRVDGDPMWDPDPEAEQVDTSAPAGPADAAPSRQGPPRDTDQPTLGDDDYDPNTHHAWAPGEVPNPDDIPLVVVTPTRRTGMIAGYRFGYRDDARVVARNRRVDDAIVNGELTYRRGAPDHAEDGARL